MPFRKCWSAESLAEVTSPSGEQVAWTDVVTLTVPGAQLEAGAKYLVLWSAVFTPTSGAVLANFRLGVNGVSTPEGVMVNRSTSDRFAWGGATVYEPGASPADVTFSVGVKSAPGNSTSPKAKEGRITVFKLTAAEFWTANVARITENAGVPVTHTTLNFTPPTPGDYLILASFLIDGNGRPGAFLQHGGNSTPLVGYSTHSSSERIPVLYAWRRNGLSGPQSVALRLQRLSNTAGLSEARLIALRISDFDAFHQAELSAPETTSSSSYVTKLSLTASLQGQRHVALAAFSAEVDGANASAAQARFTDAGVTIGEHIAQPQFATAGDNGRPAMIHRSAVYPAGSRTWTLDIRSNGFDTRLPPGSDLVVLDLGLEGAAAGVAAGVATATGAGAALRSAAGAVAGGATVGGFATAIFGGAGQAAGMAGVAGVGGVIAAAAGQAAGLAVVDGRGFAYVFTPPPPSRTYQVPRETRILPAGLGAWIWRLR